MKRQLQIVIGAATISVAACTAVAQKTSDWQSTNSYPMGGEHPGYAHAKSCKASKLMGMAVKNEQDEQVGKVRDLAIDVDSGRVVEVILYSGGFMGMGGAMNALPPGIFRGDAEEKFLRVNVDKDKLSGAPKFDGSKWDDSMQSNQVGEVYSYYGARPYFAGDAAGMNGTNGGEADTLPRHMDGTVDTTGPRPVDTEHNMEVAGQMGATTNGETMPGQMGDHSWRRGDRRWVNGDNNWSLGQVVKASKIMGAPVKNLQDEKIGKIENLMINLPAGRVTAVIISSGGFMGMDGEYSAVSPAGLRFNDESNSVTMDISKEDLTNSPHFSSQQWPDSVGSDYDARYHHDRRVMSDYGTNGMLDMSDTNRMTDADNTARNVRDRNNQSLTPLNQGNSQADINTTAQIRREILATDGMSSNAKNVKIITIDGQVTLRGPVNTENEKNMIGDIATRVASGGVVDNQLEVKSTDSTQN